MLRRLVLVLAAVACVAFTAGLRDLGPAPAVVATAMQRARTAQRDSLLLVTVRAPDGQPIAGADVTVLLVIDEHVYRAAEGKTDAEGRSSLDALPHGEAWVIVQPAERARASARVLLERGQRAVELVSGSAESFEVVVVDPGDRPLAGVDVSLFGRDPLPYRGRSDATGLVRFEALGAGPYAVEVAALGHEARFLPRLTPIDSPLFVRLDRLGGLEVAVRMPDGSPAGGATVMVAGSSLWPARSATTDATGHVTVTGLARGFYDLVARHGDLVSGTEQGLLLERGQHAEVTLDLRPGIHVDVTVTDGDHEDAATVGAADVALVEGGISPFPHYGRSDAHGHVRLGPIASFDASVSARADGFVPRSAVALEEGQTALRIALLRGGTLKGRVIDALDFPIDGATLEVVGVDLDGMPVLESGSLSSFREEHFAFALPGASSLIPMGELGVMPVVPDIPGALGLRVTRQAGSDAPWVSASDGSFTVTPVSPGRVRVIARHPSWVEAISEEVQLAPGGEAEVLLVMRRGGVLEGRVLERDRRPVAGARVELAAGSASERITFTADDGSFAFAACPEELLLSVARPEALEQVTLRLLVEVPEGKKREIEIILPEPREALSLRVRDDRGYPLDRVEVHVESLLPGEPLRRTVFTDDAGEVEVADVRGLPLRFELRRSGKAPAVEQVELAPARLELTMLEALTVLGELRSRDGPVADALCTLTLAVGDRQARSDEEGRFTLRDAGPGDALLLVLANGFAPDERRLVLAGDAHGEVRLEPIELAEAGAVSGEVIDELNEPVAGALVAIGRVPTYLPLGPLPPGITATDRQGRFVLRDVPAGAARLEAYVPGRGRNDVAVEIHAGETEDDVSIVLYDDPEAAPPRVQGATLAVTLGEHDATVVIEHVPIGGEAYRVGLRAGDRIVAVDGHPVRSRERARQLLTGPASEDLVLTVARAPDLRWSLRLRRERIR